MEDSFSSKLTLPCLRYLIGFESYIDTLKRILTLEEFTQIRKNCMGPLIKMGEMHLALSEKMIHSFLVGKIAASTRVLRFFVLKLDVFSKIYNYLKICW